MDPFVVTELERFWAWLAQRGGRVGSVILLCLALAVPLAAHVGQESQDNSGIITRILPGFRVEVQASGTNYVATVALDCKGTSDAANMAQEELAGLVGSAVISTAPLFDKGEIVADLALLRAEKYPSYENFQMVDRVRYVFDGETLVSRLVRRGLVRPPRVRGPVGELYTRSWQEAMRTGAGFWGDLGRNSWIIPEGPEARQIVEAWLGSRRSR